MRSYYLVEFETRMNGVWYKDAAEDEHAETQERAHTVATEGLAAGRGHRATISYIQVVDILVPKPQHPTSSEAPTHGS